MPTVLWLLLAATAAPAAAAADSPLPTALVIVDVQNFYFAGGRLPLERPLEASATARVVLDRFRSLHWPVIHVQHLPRGVELPDPDIADAAYRIHPSVKPLPGETVIGKHHANAFRDTQLLAELQRRQVQRVVLCGMQTHMCVEATARAAADAGFEVVVLQDACATRALTFGGVALSAEQVHAAALASLQSAYATVLPAAAFLATLPLPSTPGQPLQPRHPPSFAEEFSGCFVDSPHRHGD
ncbi:MAG: cysteine hydrolase [Thermoanaerobaculaceae bacterium]|nr:cysteine hydrolase [Thermoanaerobaculaceae bacterium]